MIKEKEPAAAWIWYPHDYEHWLHAQVSVKRQYKGDICPPFWRLDGPYTNVMFRKHYELDQPELLQLAVQGDFAIHLDGDMKPVPYEKKPVTQVLLPAGKHELAVKVYHGSKVPAVYAYSPSLASDQTWEVSRYNGRWVQAAAASFGDIAKPPGEFPFAYETRQPEAIEPLEGGGVLLDFGRETFGYVAFAGMHGKGRLRIYYGESREEAAAGLEAETYDELDINCGSAQRYQTPVTRAFRYIQVCADGALAWERIEHEYEYLPLERRGSFRCSDSLLNRIWEVSAYTLHLTMREFVLDGIKRDRWVWSGDAYQSFQMNHYLFFDPEITKRTLIALRGKDPVEMHINTIMDYTFYWFIAFYDYYLYTGDLPFIKSCYPDMLSLMAFCLGRRNDAGMMEGLPGDWVFIDWADMELRGELCAEQLLFCRSLEAMAAIAGELGDEANAHKYAELAHELRARIFGLFWDEGKGAFIHGRLDGKRIERILKYPSMFALRFGYLDARQTEQVKRNVMLEESIQKITTPFMRYFELEALCGLGEQQHVLAEIQAYWGGMLEQGATAFWEEYDPAQPAEGQYDMYGGKFRKSLCHAWGAAPLYLLGRYVLGVAPEGPGYAEYSVEPVRGGLDWIEGSVPTPHGDIAVYANQQRITVRTNAAGTGKLRFASTTEPQANAGEARPLGDGRYELELVRANFVYEVAIAQ